MKDKIEQFVEMINDSHNIVFLEELVYLLKVVFQTLEVKMVYIINMM